MLWRRFHGCGAERTAMASPPPSADHELNTLGMLCPLPLLFAVRDMKTLRAGQVLRIVGDDPGLLEDVPAWCCRAGHTLLEIEEEEGVVVCYVRKGEGA